MSRLKVQSLNRSTLAQVVGDPFLLRYPVEVLTSNCQTLEKFNLTFETVSLIWTVSLALEKNTFRLR